MPNKKITQNQIDKRVKGINNNKTPQQKIKTLIEITRLASSLK